MAEKVGHHQIQLFNIAAFTLSDLVNCASELVLLLFLIPRVHRYLRRPCDSAARIQRVTILVSSNH